MKDRFDFRRFSVRQDWCAMKVGTDGVLLGAWAVLPAQGDILDVGTGTGVVALMVAQRCDCHVVGLEIDPDAAVQAAQNAEASPWADRIEMVQGDAVTYVPDRLFDVVLSNPPFYDNRLLPPDAARCAARHTSALPFEVLARNASKWLSPGGLLQVVLPVNEETRFVSSCAGEGLFLSRRTLVVTRRPKAPRRVLLCFSRNNGRTVEEELVLQTVTGERTEAYKKLTEDFYLY